MSWIEIEPELGRLDVEEVFVTYDGPRLFTCRSVTGQTYLVTWAEARPDADHWLYMPVSPERLKMIRSGGWDLNRAFRNPEHSLFLVREPFSESENVRAVRIAPEALPDSSLPLPGTRIELPTPTLPAAISLPELRMKAEREARARLRIKVESRGVFRTEAPTRTVGEILLSTQSAVDNIVAVQRGRDVPARGRLPADALREAASDLVSLSAASFVIEIVSRRLDDLFGNSPFAEAASTLVELTLPDLPTEELAERLTSLRPRAAKNFRGLIRALASVHGSVRLEAASSIRESATDLTATQLQDLVRRLNLVVPDDVIEHRGLARLYRADLTRKQFGVEDVESGARYEGRIADRALPQVDHAELMSEFEVVVTEIRDFDQGAGELRPRYVLEQLAQSGDEPRPGMTHTAISGSD